MELGCGDGLLTEQLRDRGVDPITIDRSLPRIHLSIGSQLYHISNNRDTPDTYNYVICRKRRKGFLRIHP